TRVVQEGASAVEDVAGETALVLSPSRFHDFSRWAATDLPNGEIALDPPDALERFAGEGSRRELPPVEQSLGALVTDELEVEAALPEDGVRLRKLMMALSTEEGARSLGLEAAQRHALAQRLEIPAASHPEERREAHHAALRARLEGAGLPSPTTCSE